MFKSRDNILVASLVEQRRHVGIIICLLGGETDGEERMVQMIENPKEELGLENLKSEIFKIRI